MDTCVHFNPLTLTLRRANYLQRKIDVREDENIAAGQSLCASSTVMDSSMLPMIAQHITLCKKSQFIHLPPLGIFSIHFVVEHTRINTISCHRHAEFRLIFRLFIHSFIQKEEIWQRVCIYKKKTGLVLTLPSQSPLAVVLLPYMLFLDNSQCVSLSVH